MKISKLFKAAFKTAVSITSYFAMAIAFIVFIRVSLNPNPAPIGDILWRALEVVVIGGPISVFVLTPILMYFGKEDFED